MPQAQGKQVQIKIADEVLKGFYSNLMRVTNGKEEFVIDFASVVGEQGVVGARVITSPRHYKSMVAALTQHLKKYEEQFGKIEEGGPQDKPEFGFKTQP